VARVSPVSLGLYAWIPALALESIAEDLVWRTDSDREVHLSDQAGYRSSFRFASPGIAAVVIPLEHGIKRAGCPFITKGHSY
jgi:hypothetical protein